MNIKSFYISSILILTAIIQTGCSNHQRPATKDDISIVPVEEDISSESYEEIVEEIQTITHEHIAVDLGLASRVNWATENVGAEHCYEFGEYYAMGVTTPWEQGRYPGPFGDYENKPRFSFTLLGNPKYDAATANWGEEWRMPTSHDFYELYKSCAWVWINLNGTNGYRIIGPNGNQIFLPAAGYKQNPEPYATNEDGYYWAAPEGETTNRAEPSSFLTITSDRRGFEDKLSYSFGLSIRPITDFDEYCMTNESGNNTTNHETELSKTKTGEIAGHQYVDLGLPSGTKWATMNIDATCFFDYGSHFEWGAINPQESFKWDDGKTLGNSEAVENISGNPKYDAATAMWGESWRLPTKEEVEELVDKCEWKTVLLFNESGRKEDTRYAHIAMGPNKNLIIFPAYLGNRGQKLTSIWCCEPEYSNTAYAMDLTHETYHKGKQSPVLYTTKQNMRLRIRPVSK